MRQIVKVDSELAVELDFVTNDDISACLPVMTGSVLPDHAVLCSVCNTAPAGTGRDVF
jgi:hypothetical protein